MQPSVPLFHGDEEPQGAVIPASWYLVLGQPAFNHMLVCCGVVPTAELRNTIAQELNKQAPDWLKDVIQSVVSDIQHAN